jgi:pimeloyl-ACP methyl ester carboxylesterase
MNLALETRDQRRLLPDGRVQQWLELGPIDGDPVLFCHGGNDCRLEALWIADAVQAAGVRLIVPDRPGFGGSTHDPGRTFGSWAADALDLLDALGVGFVRVLGLSGGGPHALAVAALAPERVDAVDVVASPCPWDEPGFLDGTWLPIRLTYLMARYAPDALFAPLQRAMNDAERNLKYADRMPGPDARLLASRPEVGRAMVRSVTEAHQQGVDGAVHEWRLYTASWGFSLADVVAPVRMWYGTDDGMAPPAMGRRLADRLPCATLAIVPNRAHLSLFVQDAWRFLRPVPALATRCAASAAG